MPQIKQIVLVGHCGADSGTLRYAVTAALGALPVHAANDHQALERYCTSATLLLVNRVLDGWFDTGSGIDLIARLAAQSGPPRMMLISNYPDAQAQAVAAGAVPGFGKSQAHDAAVARLLQAAMESPQPVDPG